MHMAAEIIDTVKTALGASRPGGHMVAVVGKLLSRGEARGFAHYLVTFDHELAAVFMGDDPFATEQRDGVFGAVVNRDEINKRVRLVRRQALAPVMIHELVEAGGEAGKCERSGHGNNQFRRGGFATFGAAYFSMRGIALSKVRV
jgi:hypothetical protein